MADKGDFPKGITTESLVGELSRRMKLTVREADKFRHMTMSRCGYKMVPTYVRPDEDKDARDDDYPF